MTEISDDTPAASDLEALSYEECMAHLAEHQVGRLVVVVGHYPQVFPVNYRMDDHVVVFRTHVGTKLLAAHLQNVAFQIDQFDPVHRTGWSVAVQGMAEDLAARRADTVGRRSDALGVRPWACGDKPRLVRIIPARVTGRRIVAHELGWPTDGRGYL